MSREIEVCVAYRIDGEEVRQFPSDLAALGRRREAQGDEADLVQLDAGEQDRHRVFTGQLGERPTGKSAEF